MAEQVTAPLVRLNLPDVDAEGKSTFQPDFENNKLHRTLNAVANRYKRFIDLSGADRSVESEHSKVRHSDQNAVDIDFDRNPTWFVKGGNGKLTPAGKDLVKSLLAEGLRIQDGDGHMHIDRLTSEVDGFGSLEKEKGGKGILFKEVSEIMKTAKPNTVEQAKEKAAIAMEDFDTPGLAEPEAGFRAPLAPIPLNTERSKPFKSVDELRNFLEGKEE